MYSKLIASFLCLLSCAAYSADPYLNGYDTTNGRGLYSTDADYFGLATKEFGLSTNFGTVVHTFNGMILETIDGDVSSDGVTITFSLEANGGGDLTLYFSDDFTTFDSTPAATVTLTAGSDTSPQLNYVYILQSNKTLTASTAGWPSAEHAPVVTVVCQSASTVQSSGALKTHFWTDHSKGSDGQGHQAHQNFWIRQQHATWISGAQGTATIATGPSPDTVDISISSGSVLQLHPHAMPALDTASGDPVYVVNDSASAYTQVTDIEGILTDADGDSMSGKYFNVVLWGVCSEKTVDSHMMLNLPTGSYTVQADAESDANGETVYDIPSAFKGTGFLIAKFLFQHQAGGGGQHTLIETIDLRGSFPTNIAGVGGAGSGATSFADNVFAVYDEGDDTKRLAFQVSGVTTGNTRTMTVPDSDGTLIHSATSAGGDLTGTYPNPTIASDKVLESHLKAVDAAVDEDFLTYESTTGDFEWLTANAGTDITADLEEETHASEHALALDTAATADQLGFARTATLAGDPALSASHATFSTTGIIFEGSTADTLETLLNVTDPTSTDKTITLPNASGTVAVSATSPVTLSAAGAVGLTQNAGTDVTADLEEETHASEHALSLDTAATGDQLGFARTATLAGDPALSASHATFSTTGIIFEGATADTIETLLAVTDPTATDKTVTIPNASGTVAVSAASPLSLSALGALSLGTVPVASGGTNITSYAVGDILYASGATTLAKLADVATGNALISGGVGVAPSYGKIGLTTHISGALPVANGGTNVTSYAVGDLLYASGATALSKLADVATGNALISGGVGVAPSYGKVGLTTHVSGTLPVANGGTNKTSWTAGSVAFAGTSGTALAENNSKLFWNNSTNALGIGTASPAQDLSIIATSPALAMGWSAADNIAGLDFAFATRATQGLMVGTWASYPASLWTNNTQRVTVASGGNVGVGTTSPGSKLDVQAATGATPTYGYAAEFLNSGDDEFRVGIQIQAGHDDAGDGEPAAIWADLNLNNGALFATIEEVAGDVDFVLASDPILKRDVEPTRVNALDAITRLNLIEYRWDQTIEDKLRKRGELPEIPKKEIGFNAVDVEQVFPDLVNERMLPVLNDDFTTTVRSIKRLSTRGMIPYLIRAIQQQQEQIETLQQENQRLRADVNAIKQRLGMPVADIPDPRGPER